MVEDCILVSVKLISSFHGFQLESNLSFFVKQLTMICVLSDVVCLESAELSTLEFEWIVTKEQH